MQVKFSGNFCSSLFAKFGLVHISNDLSFWLGLTLKISDDSEPKLDPQRGWVVWVGLIHHDPMSLTRAASRGSKIREARAARVLEAADSSVCVCVLCVYVWYQ